MINKIAWYPSKVYGKNKINVTVSLDDDCKNGFCDFSITCDIYEKKKGGRWECVGGGCDHEEIIKHFPELKKFIPLHCCWADGSPSYPVENGIYHIQHSTPETAKKYLRVTDDEFIALSYAVSDKLYFRYLLVTLGIVERWKAEAAEFIRFIEAKSEEQFKTSYTVNKWAVQPLTDEEKKIVEARIETDYYNLDNIKRRVDAARLQKTTEERQEVIKDYIKAEKKARQEMEVKLVILDFGIPLDNVIYYTHLNKVVFNWKSWVDPISEEEFNNFVNSVDKNKLPEGIKFQFGEDKK